jgi:tRNA (guanine-N7-)-methyltransferase
MSDAGAGDPARTGAFYGRRKGHRLRDHQAGLVDALLPALRVDIDLLSREPRALFARPVADVYLEIGFGGGEHLAHEARRHPDIGFIGCEPFLNGMAKLLAAVESTGTDTIRLHDGDALPLLGRLPAGSLGRVDLLYPDPWPKRRHHKRRFVSEDSLAALARVVRPGGLFRFVSDIDHYVGWTLARVLRSPDWAWTAQGPDDWRKPFEGWPGTRYEAKARREGRVPSYLELRRRSA